MSAYIVDEECMNRVIRGVATALNGEGFTDSATLTALGQRLFVMNADAVLARYPNYDDYKAGLELSDTFSLPLARKVEQAKTVADMVACFKAMSCLLYQCTEGEVPERIDYKALKELQARLAVKITITLPEYEKAQW